MISKYSSDYALSVEIRKLHFEIEALFNYGFSPRSIHDFLYVCHRHNEIPYDFVIVHQGQNNEDDVLKLSHIERAIKGEITEHMVRRAESNGFRAIIFTTVLGRRKDDITNN
ncbi:hypothetical protein KY290_026120 [Solanum tuberosum]|uniref:Uncharacterized protein n=1 Tax=Solanum tuberosum TaxID=4113 RepID=A0ABQ7UVH8_SOLTU|nr:hypothetical protein KY284_025801 [Solanum tuberosum]KAH0755850.1 hypothetical protein KY290_026120 [Solanum tuberosum]